MGGKSSRTMEGSEAAVTGQMSDNTPHDFAALPYSTRRRISLAVISHLDEDILTAAQPAPDDGGLPVGIANTDGIINRDDIDSAGGVGVSISVGGGSWLWGMVTWPVMSPAKGVKFAAGAVIDTIISPAVSRVAWMLPQGPKYLAHLSVNLVGNVWEVVRSPESRALWDASTNVVGSAGRAVISPEGRKFFVETATAGATMVSALDTAELKAGVQQGVRMGIRGLDALASQHSQECVKDASNATIRLVGLLNSGAAKKALSAFESDVVHTLATVHDSALVTYDNNGSDNNVGNSGSDNSGDGDSVRNGAVGGTGGRLLDWVVWPLWGAIKTTGSMIKKVALALYLIIPFGVVLGWIVPWLVPRLVRDLSRTTANIACNAFAVARSSECGVLVGTTGTAVGSLGMAVSCPKARNFLLEGAECASHVASALDTPQAKAFIRQGAMASGAGLNWAASRHCKGALQGVADVARRGAELTNSAGVINAVSTFVSDATKLLNVSDTTDADNGPVPTTGEWSTGAGGPDDVVTPDTDRIGDPHAIEEDEVEVGVADVGSQEGGSRDDAYQMMYDVRDDLVDLPGFSFETLRSVLRRSELRREGGLRLGRQFATAVLR